MSVDAGPVGSTTRLAELDVAVRARCPMVQKTVPSNYNLDVSFVIPHPAGSQRIAVLIVGAGFDDGSDLQWWVDRAVQRIERAAKEGR